MIKSICVCDICNNIIENKAKIVDDIIYTGEDCNGGQNNNLFVEFGRKDVSHICDKCFNEIYDEIYITIFKDRSSSNSSTRILNTTDQVI
jgi:hypothetical protein